MVLSVSFTEIYLQVFVFFHFIKPRGLFNKNAVSCVNVTGINMVSAIM